MMCNCITLYIIYIYPQFINY